MARSLAATSRGALFLVTVCACALLPDAQRRAYGQEADADPKAREETPAKKAFLGRAVYNWPNHLTNLGSILTNKLGWTTTKVEEVYENDFKTHAPNHDLWYLFAHGALKDGEFVGIAIWKDTWGTQVVYPNDAKGWVNGKQYVFVFLNGCWTAQTNPGTAAKEFKAAFSAKVYLGWDSEPGAGVCVLAAGDFFDALDGAKTVDDAIKKIKGDHAEYEKLRVIGDGSVVIDLKP